MPFWERVVWTNGAWTKAPVFTEPEPLPSDPFVVGTTVPSALNTGTGFNRDGFGNVVTVAKPTTVHTGDYTANTANEVIQNTIITGRIIVSAANVKIRNCEIKIGTQSSDGRYGIHNTTTGATGTVVEFCEIYGANPSTYVNGIGVKDFTAFRCHIHHVVDAFRVYTATGVATNVVMEANYSHDMLLLTPDVAFSGTRADNKTHCDIVQLQGGAGTVIRGNYFNGTRALASWGATTDGSDYVLNTSATSPFPPVSSGGVLHAQCNSAIIVTPDIGQVTNLLVENNWLSGGEATFHAGSSSNTGFTGTMRNNIFTKDTFNSTSGSPYTGSNTPLSVYIDSSVSVTAFIMTGNSYDTGGTVPRVNG